VLAEKGKIFVNHIGFIPKSPKYFVVMDPPAKDFQIIRRMDKKTVFSGQLQEVSGDLGNGWIGTFSEVSEEGTYLIRCGNLQSRVVTIYKDIYDYPLRTIFNYFPSQRCGDSITGWHSPCHITDGRRIDTGEHIDVTGGWHQSCDLRKWTFGTSYGLLGLVQLGFRKPRWNTGQIAEEVLWGNQYFHKMIRPDGGLMDHVVIPLGWIEERNIYPNNAPSVATYTTIIGQALSAKLFESDDTEYSHKCLEIAKRMWQYITGPDYPHDPYEPPVIPKYHEWMPGFFNQNYPGSALDLGDSLYAALMLFRATRENTWLEEAISRASALVDLQVGGDAVLDPAAACFYVGPGRADYVCAYCDGIYGPIGLTELIQLLPNHKYVGKWLRAIYLLAEQKSRIASKNPWGLVPSYWYRTDPSGGRKAGSGYYRYFYEYHGVRFGLNFDILGNALFLLRAHKITGNRRYRDIAYRQLDWILGCNPFDASTVEGVGRNQPERLINTDEFFPPTPQIPGAVMTGICGTQEDEPAELGLGSDVEYDMPPTSLLMWLLVELQEIVD